MPIFALLPSPLLGPATWRGTAEVMATAGYDVVVVSPPVEALSVRTILDGFGNGLPSGDLVLVPHSNAGLYAPALAAGRSVVATVYVDAALQSPTGTSRRDGRPEFYDLLAAKADTDGVLPVWTEWWDEDLTPLFPNAEVRADVEREQRRLPLACFTEIVPAPVGWESDPAAYLAFGEAYATEIGRARGLGWPVRTLPGDHLEMTHHPEDVAAALVELVSELVRDPD